MTVPLRTEEFAELGDGISLCYQTYGDPAAEPLLLVMGLGGPMTWWNPKLCERLANRGFFVIRYDNRDIGRSTYVEGRVTRGDIVRAWAGRPVRAPYTMDDLAADAAGLLDHLSIASAHVVGVSLGGMIAQTLAIKHPERVASLVSIMSTTGSRRVGWQHPKLMLPMLSRTGTGLEGYVDSSLRVWRLNASPRYPTPVAEERARAVETYERGWRASGVLRQMMAVLTQRDRSADLRRLNLPTAVLHGLADPLVHVSGGRATARLIPNAELVLVPGMGHDLPVQLHPLFADVIARTAARSYLA